MFRVSVRTIPSLVFLLSCAGSLVLAADYVPGGPGTIVENWMTKDGEQALTVGRPVCLYIYSGIKGNNPEAKFLEGSDFLGNADIQQTLKKNFMCLKMDVSRSDKMPKKWPPVLVDRAKSWKFAVVLLSSDFVTQAFFRKNASDGVSTEATPKAFLATAESIVKFEAQKKLLADKNAKPEKAEPKPDEKKIRVPGLPDPDKEKGPKKPDETKPAKPKPSTPQDE